MSGLAQLSFVVTVAGLLFLVLPALPAEGQDTLGSPHPPGQASQPSELSVRHLRALVVANPDDQYLQLQLARALFAAGDVEGAARTLAPIRRAPGTIGYGARELAVTLEVTRFHALTGPSKQGEKQDDKEREEARERVLGAVHARVEDPMDVAALEELAKIALEMEAPRLAGEIYERVAREDAVKRGEWLASAARWHRAAGDEGRAARLYATATKVTPAPARRLELGLLSVDSSARAGDPRLAHSLAERLLREFPDNPAVLERAVRFASASGDVNRARDVGRTFVSSFALNDPEAVARQVERELASGELTAALTWLRRLAELRPNDVSVHTRMEQVAEWSGDPKYALREYRWLATHHVADLAMIDRAVALARSLHDMPAVLELLVLRTRFGPSREADVLELARAYEDVGQPEQAAEVLRDHARAAGPARGRRRHLVSPEEPGVGAQGAPPTGAGRSRQLLKRQALLEEERGAPEFAIQAWSELRDAYGLDGAEARTFASLLWRMDDARGALAVLLGVKESEPGRDLAFWTLLGEVAEEVNDRDVARRALLEQRARGDRSSALLERLSGIEYGSGRFEAAATYAAGAYRAKPEARTLFFAVELLVKIERDQDAVVLLREEAARDKEILQLEEYWRHLGSSLQRTGRLREACAAYEEGLNREPSSVVAFDSVLGCALERNDEATLARFVDGPWRQRVEKEPRLLGSFALALVRLRRYREAIVYLVRLVRARPHDYAWQLELADAVEQGGDPSLAHRLRRHALLKLGPRAIAALKAPSSDEEATAALVAQAILKRRFEGPAASYRWLERLLPKGRGPIQDGAVLDLAISFYLSDGNTDAVRRALLRSSSLRAETERGLPLALALQENNVVEIERLLAQPPEQTGGDTDLRVQALLRVGKDGEALRALDEAVDRPSARMDRDKIEELRKERAEVAERAAPTAHASYSVDVYGPLLAHGPRVSAVFHPGQLGVDGDFRRNQMYSASSDTDFPAGTSAEYDGIVGLRLRTLRSLTRLAVGANARIGVAAPQAVLAHKQQILGRDSSLLGELKLQGIPTDTPILRAVGVRDSAELEATFALSENDRVELSATGFRERTVRQDHLAVGGTGTLVLEHEIIHARPQWTVLATGAIMGRSLGQSTSAALQGAGVSPDALPSDLLQTSAYTVTLGSHLQNGDPASPWGAASFPRYSLALDLGRIWPAQQWVVEARGGAGTRLFGDDILGVTAYYNIGLAGAPDDPFYGVSLHYTRGIR